MNNSILTTFIGSLELKNPVTVASGTTGYGSEMAPWCDVASLGAVFTKGISLKPRPGNDGPRILETPAGVLNSIGLENVGLDVFLEQKLPWLFDQGIEAIPNVAGHSIEENVELCRTLSSISGINALELNVSCPNVKEGGLAFGQNTETLARLLDSVRPVTKGLLIVKLSPNVTSIADFARTAQQCGADAVSAVNTFLGMKINLKTRKPHFNNRYAGLSGPAIRALAVRAVYDIYAATRMPVVGLGGITSADDALEFIMAGASAISIGTMNMAHPSTATEVLQGLHQYCEKESCGIRDLIGAAHNTEAE